MLPSSTLPAPAKLSPQPGAETRPRSFPRAPGPSSRRMGSRLAGRVTLVSEKEQAMSFRISNLAVAVVALAVLGLTVGSTIARAAEKDIVDTAVSAGQFKTLASALDAAGLVETLKGDGPFTVFAPTDEAFAKLPAGTLENLLKPENKDQLVAILTYHVVPGKVEAADVVKLNEAKTVNGKMIDIKVKGDTAMVNDAKVTKADIAASNGVIHVISLRPIYMRVYARYYLILFFTAS